MLALYYIEIKNHKKRMFSLSENIRILLSTDYRIFVPIARDSKKFKKKYKMRTSATGV